MTSKAARKKRNTPAPGQAGPHFEALEPRLLLSADPLGGALATDYLADKDPSEIDEPGVLEALLEALAPTHSDAATSLAPSELPPPVDLEALAALSTMPEDGTDTTDNLDTRQPHDLTEPLIDAADRHELLFVDARVSDLQRLLDDLDITDRTRDIDIVVLDPDRNGVAQVTETLLGYTDLDAVHFVSHGADGRLQLGDTWLGSENLDDYEVAIHTWQQALADDADLLIYGCNLAETGAGEAFIDRLSALTAADVAASDDLTGATQRGGDWALEYRSGDIETASAFTQPLQQTWEGSLAPAPGGVASSITLWLKADAGVTTSGGDVTKWDNQVASGTLPDVRQGTSSERPDLNTLALNFNPVVTFDGVDDSLRDASVLGTDLFAPDKGSVIAVVRMNDEGVVLQWEQNTNNRVNLENASSSPRFDFGDDMPPDSLTGSNISTGYHVVNVQAMPATPANLQIFVDGKLDVQNDASSATPLNPAVNGVFSLGEWAGGGVNINMDLAEVIVYDSDLSGIDQLRIDSYLALKYGITLDQSTPTDYLDSSSNVIWDATANAGYGNDIAGVGQDNGSTLNQSQSQSINNDSILTVSLASDQDDGEFLFWANDDGALTETAAGTPAAVSQQLQRIWKVEETGDLGTTTLTFDLNALPVSGTVAGDFNLIIDNDTDFSSGATLVSASGYAGGMATFTGVDLDDGRFFALGTEANLAPTANASAAGPYEITEGESVSFDGAASSAPDGAITTYEWDIGNNGTFEASGMGVMFTWAGLTGAGVNDDGTYNVALRVTDNNGATNTQVFTLTVNNTAPTLSVSGASSVDEDVAYSLDLTATDPGAESLTWYVNWGDGNVSSHAATGVTTTVTHTFVQEDVGFTREITVSATDEDGRWSLSDLLVAGTGNVVGADGSNDGIFRFDGATGDFVSAFDDPAQISDSYQVITGPDGKYYATGFVSNNVVRFNTDGTLDTEFVASGGGGLSGATGLIFGPDGKLYVASYFTNQVLRYNADGSFDKIFGDSGGVVSGPAGIAFGPDGDLYVTSRGNGKLFSYDGIAGGTPTSVIDSGLAASEQLYFDAAGDLFIADGLNDRIARYDGALTTFTTGGTIAYASGLAVGPDGSWYVSSFDDDTILRYDAGGSFDTTFVTAGAGGLDGPFRLCLTPAHLVLVDNVNDNPAGSPTITGTVQEDQTLSANIAAISDDDGLPASFSYQWQSSTDGGATWNNVGVDAATYGLGDADVGALMRVQVSYTDLHGTAEGPLISAATAAVTNVNDNPAGSPTITGTVQEDQTLSANIAAISDDDGLPASFSYQWQSSTDGGATWNNVGVDAATYGLGDADVGALMRVQVSYTDLHGTVEGPLISAATAAVTNVNDNPAGSPTITGTVQEDQTLSANIAAITDDDGLPASFSYQWQRSTDSGATWNNVGVDAATYGLGDADVGALMSVQVRYTDAQGTVETLTSAQTAAVVNVNDAPALGNNRLAITDGGTVILLGTDLSANDVDHPDAALLFSVTNLSGGQFELVSNPGVAATGFTQAQVTGGQVHFVHDGSGAAPAYEVSVSDGGLVDGPVAAVISFTGTGNTIEPPPDVKPVPDVKPLPDIKPFPDVKPLPDIEPAPEPIDVDNGDPDVPPADETETVTTVEGVPGGSVTVVDEERLLPPVEIDEPLTPDADNDRGTASPGSQGTFQTVMKAIATRPAALQALLGGVATAYGFSWGDLSALESDEYRQQLDRLRDDVAGDIFVDQTVVGSSIAVSTGLSVGYVLWLVRGGVLLSSVLSSLPAWRLIDPLPVLAYVKNRPEDDQGDEDSLESLVEKKEPRPDEESDDDTDIERGERR